jgi:hypothetical protein
VAKPFCEVAGSECARQAKADRRRTSATTQSTCMRGLYQTKNGLLVFFGSLRSRKSTILPRVLEKKLQEIFSPFRLPIELKLRTVGCDGVSNALYQKPAVSVCYEYLAEIQQSLPPGTTQAGITPMDQGSTYTDFRLGVPALQRLHFSGKSSHVIRPTSTRGLWDPLQQRNRPGPHPCEVVAI